jgi:hypothetical protein
MFVRNGNRLVNLGLVATAEVGPVNTRGVAPITLRTASGAEVGVVRECDIDLESLTAPVVASAAEAVFIDQLTGAARWVPIIGWRLLRQGAEPVFGASKPGALRPGGIMFLRTADGALIGAGNRFDSLDSAKAAVTAGNQENGR